LAGMPGLVRVFLTASVAWRTERLMESFHFTRERAAAELVRTDAARRRVAKDHYKMTWGDPRNYDLILDTERFGVEGTVSIVVAAVRIAASA
ncbi:MAG: cytidylate kinase family protein, partial [Candidatus Eremiobacteraeota bacterium]|nr:cytidylate kinase family protein [Candidatus Eremiobacteraeota bacterium]